MIFQRYYSPFLSEQASPGKVLVLYGARRTGKTWLIKHFLEGSKERVYQGTGDDSSLRAVLEKCSISDIKALFGGYDMVFIDEAQRIAGIGNILKLMIDTLPTLRIIATGSSSFELAHQVGEPLTGRKKTLKLYPMSVLELNRQWGGMYCEESLESMLIYGTYPEVLTLASPSAKTDYLIELRDSALYKDILELDSVRNAKKIGDLLRLVAFQVGREVSYRELATQLGLNVKTVERYLDLLEKAFVLFNVRGFSRNLRKEISKTSRYFFLDNGILNALTANFNALPLRNDVGVLWENFVFMERLKRNTYLAHRANYYFWRTYDQQEIDLVEEHDGKLASFEFKYRSTKIKKPKAWGDAYPQATYDVISRSNYLPFMTESSHG
ncbi:MAG: hypothetical protein A2X46_16020 [Lentisphaerae bacterium GWF2_57_35]|nr:MAG: hypothetical protein A2X46_16020 [Lentisphaerae bacterium GWF2_57_35]